LLQHSIVVRYILKPIYFTAPTLHCDYQLTLDCKHVIAASSLLHAKFVVFYNNNKSVPRQQRHCHLNDIIWRAMKRAQIHAVKEPVGLMSQDGKRPDGTTI